MMRRETAGVRAEEAKVPDQETAVRDKMVNALLQATVGVFRSDLGVDLRLDGSEVSEAQATTEDLSVFTRFTGRIEGCVFLAWTGA